MTHRHHPSNGWHYGAANDDPDTTVRQVRVLLVFDSRTYAIRTVVALGALMTVALSAVGVGLFLLIPVLWRLLPWS